MAEVYESGSPRWSWTTKLVVGLTIVAILAGLVLRFRNYIGPLLLVFMLTFMTYPIAQKIRTTLRISWRLAVTLVYLIIILLLVGLLTAGGLVVVEQSQSLYSLINTAVTKQLPALIENIQGQVFTIGPFFRLDMAQFNLDTASEQILSYVQPLLGRVGTLITAVAGGVGSFLGMLAFILLISYFITSESGGRRSLMAINIPGHSYDFKRMSIELRHTWSAFLRGQLILFILTVLLYSVVLTLLEVRYSLGLALLAGFGRFLPYVGPAIAWTAYALVTFFQGHTIFGLTPLAYTGLVIGVSVVLDSAFDNFISPKFLGQTLKVHPAAVLIAALIAANLIGVIGVLLAAPVLATLQILGRYTLRKLFDLDPWEDIEPPPANSTGSLLPLPLTERLAEIRAGLGVAIQKRWQALRRREPEPGPAPKSSSDPRGP